MKVYISDPYSHLSRENGRYFINFSDVALKQPVVNIDTRIQVNLPKNTYLRIECLPSYCSVYTLGAGVIDCGYTGSIQLIIYPHIHPVVTSLRFRVRFMRIAPSPEELPENVLEKAYPDDAGHDMITDVPVTLAPKQSVIRWDLPNIDQPYLIMPKSGLSLKGINVCDVGEHIVVCNNSSQVVTINQGNKFAQLIFENGEYYPNLIHKDNIEDFEETDELESSRELELRELENRNTKSDHETDSSEDNKASKIKKTTPKKSKSKSTKKRAKNGFGSTGDK